MSYPAPPPQPGWYPDPVFVNNVVGPGSGPINALHLALTLLTCGVWLPVWLVLAINDNRQTRAAGQPARSNPALVAVVVVIGGLYLVGLATTDLRVFISLVAVAVLAYVGYRA